MMQSAQRRWDQALWLAVLLATLALCCVFHADESRIEAQVDNNARLAVLIRSDQEQARRLPTLRRDRNRLMMILDRLADVPDVSTAIAAFLRDAQYIAARHRIAVASIVSGVSPTATAGTSTPSYERTEPFDAIPLELTLAGPYRDVLGTVADLSTAHIPAAIEVESIARRSPDGPDNTVTATLRITLDRLVLRDVPDVRNRHA